MEKIYRSALVMHTAQQMYGLVDDIESYSQFVPNCKSASIIVREENVVSATLEVSKSGIAKSFSTKNCLTPHSSIKMELLDGPFKHLTGEWLFTPLSEEACKIELYIEFEFSNKLASVAFKSVFSQLVQSMVTAFTDRAKTIHG